MTQLMEGDDKMKKKQSVNQSVSQSVSQSKLIQGKLKFAKKARFVETIDTGNAFGRMNNESVSKIEVKKS